MLSCLSQCLFRCLFRLRCRLCLWVCPTSSSQTRSSSRNMPPAYQTSVTLPPMVPWYPLVTSGRHDCHGPISKLGFLKSVYGCPRIHHTHLSPTFWSPRLWTVRGESHISMAGHPKVNSRWEGLCGEYQWHGFLDVSQSRTSLIICSDLAYFGIVQSFLLSLFLSVCCHFLGTLIWHFQLVGLVGASICWIINWLTRKTWKTLDTSRYKSRQVTSHR